MPDGMIHTAYYDYHSSFSTAGVPGLLFWFFYVKMDKVSRMPNVPRFTDEDAAKVVTEYGKTVLGPGYTLQDLWDNRVRATLAPLEEGVSKKWSNGRVVLVGDAVHKVYIHPLQSCSLELTQQRQPSIPASAPTRPTRASCA